MQVDLNQSLPPLCEGIQVQPSQNELKQLAPSGQLRVTINIGNDVLTRQARGVVSGISVDITQVLSKQLGLPLKTSVVTSAGESYQRVASGRTDLGFFGISPDRAMGTARSGASEGVAYTTPYIQILGSYAVTKTSAITSNSEIDQAGNTVVVGRGSVYSLWLQRHLDHAKVVEAPTSPDVVPYMLANGYTIGAGIRNQLLSDATREPSIRVLDGHFMVIHQAMATGQGRSEAIDYLNRFLKELNVSGCLASLASRNELTGYRLSAPEEQAERAPDERKSPLQF